MTGKEDDADEYMERAVNTYTDLINKGENYYFQRGHCYIGFEKYKEALADFDKALELNPESEIKDEISELRDECIRLMDEELYILDKVKIIKCNLATLFDFLGFIC